MRTRIFVGLVAVAVVSACSVPARAVLVGIDLAPTSLAFDDFNDGVDTAMGFNNMVSAGEAAGVSSVTMPPNASDPWLQYPTPAAINPFDVNTYPYLRVHTQATVGGGGQVFPWPPSGVTVLGYGNTVGAFGEARMQFNTGGPSVNGTGLRIDPLGGGTANTEQFDFDYIMLDQFPTVGLGEFDRDGGMDGWNIAVGIINDSVSAATSTFSGTTSGGDPVLQRVGIPNFPTSVYDVLEVNLAVDPLSTSRLEIFWGTDLYPGPAGGQSVVLLPELIRDGQLHTYRFRMSDDARWAGNLNMLRIDPLADADAAAGRDFAIGYVRLISGAPVPEPSSIVLAALALAGLAVVRRRR